MNVRNLVMTTFLLLLAACGGSEEQQATGKPGDASEQREGSATSMSASVTSAAIPAAFNTCRSCHSVEKGQNGIGPSLFGIVGRKAAIMKDYPFSPALKASGVIWNPDSLDKWLQGPTKMVPGTKMVIAVPDAGKRKAIIDYLKSLK